jgi:hypothetical protein
LRASASLFSFGVFSSLLFFSSTTKGLAHASPTVFSRSRGCNYPATMPSYDGGCRFALSLFAGFIVVLCFFVFAFNTYVCQSIKRPLVGMSFVTVRRCLLCPAFVLRNTNWDQRLKNDQVNILDARCQLTTRLVRFIMESGEIDSWHGALRVGTELEDMQGHQRDVASRRCSRAH